ncbi:MAG: CidA/LrgA family protein [Halanaerobium sp.]
MKLVRQFSIILLIAFSGEVINYFFNTPIPANVLAMIILLTLLTTGIVKLKMIDQVANFMLAHLAIFFVPPGVNLINNLDLLKNDWLAILTIIVVSTIVIMVVTGFTIQLLKRRST